MATTTMTRWGSSSAPLGFELLEQGDVDGGWGGALDEAPRPASELSDAVRFHRNARLALLLAEGRDAEALAVADALRIRQQGWLNPLMHRWRSGKAIALARLDRRDEALPLMEEELELSPAQGRTTARSARRCGWRGELTGDVALLEEAVASARRLDGAARAGQGAATPLGVTARRRRRCSSARTRWRAGSGALPVLAGARARRSARARRGRPVPDGRRRAERGSSGGSPTLAAEGRPNRDIAQALFLTPRDVDKRHLAAAAGKLGSDSRRALAAALAS